MDFFLEGFRLFVSRFGFIMALITLIGLLLLRKPAADVIKGTVKALVGVLILQQGSGLLQAAYRPTMLILRDAFDLSGIITENYAGWAAINEALAPPLLAVVPQVMLFGFLFNLVFARLTPLKYVFLSGHTMLAFATLLAWIMHWFFGVEGTLLVFSAALFCGIYWTVMPAWVHRYSKPFTGDNFTLGHISGTSAVISSWIGKLMGGYNKDTNPKIHDEEEAFTLKGIGSILNDSTVVTALLMTVVLGSIALLAGRPYIEQHTAQHWVIFTVELGAQFTVGLVILLTGVRMLIAEIVPAFKGISEKLIPNAIPGLDMPVYFPLAPLSAILGFLGAFIGQFVGFGIQLAASAPILMLPGIIATFFDGGISGVFGFKYGGRKAALICGIVVGLVQSLGGMIFTQISGMATLGATYGNTDFGSIWVAIAGLMSVISNIWVFLPLLVVAFGICIFLLKPKKEVKASA